MEKKRAYTGDELRAIAEGVDNANSGCERLAEIFYAAVKADKARHTRPTGFVWCDCGDGYPAGSISAKFMAENGKCDNCQASER